MKKEDVFGLPRSYLGAFLHMLFLLTITTKLSNVGSPTIPALPICIQINTHILSSKHQIASSTASTILQLPPIKQHLLLYHANEESYTRQKESGPPTRGYKFQCRILQHQRISQDTTVIWEVQKASKCES